MRRWVGMVCLVLVRCQSCLPPLLPDDTALTPLPSPPPVEAPTNLGPFEPTGVPPTDCIDETDCSEGFCCGSVCQACCQTSDCGMSVDGVQLLCAGGVCVPCGASASCSVGDVCCAPGEGNNNASIAACMPGVCCSDADCVGQPGGDQCINNLCSLGMCMGASTPCQSTGLCCDSACVAGATCCSDADCSGGQVCAGNACGPCGPSAACGAGLVCCGGSCTSGNCCATADCANPLQACVGNSCGACTADADCGGNDCCNDPTLGNICLPASGCCPGETLCDANVSPTARACSMTSRTCTSCDATSAPCAPGRNCCNGACITDGNGATADGGECCDGTDCASGLCDNNVCVECIGTCGTATAATGVSVCDPTSDTCEACDGTHPCGGGEVCCGGACFAGTCCGNGDCGGQTPVCAQHLCRGCGADGDCGSGQVCVAPSGSGTCPSGVTTCQCRPGDCHVAAQISPSDCAGACCNYQCAVGGQCCSNSDCTAATPGHQASHICSSVVSAASTLTCNGSHTCACPNPSGGVVYVDATLGNDGTGNGSAECPWRSIGRALGNGTTVNVRPGTYTSESFPLDVPSGTTLQRDPTCTSGNVVVLRNDGNTTSCPVQRGTNVSCAIAVRAAGVTLRDLLVKNPTGRAIAFGSGADGTTQLVSGVIGCQAPSGCDRGGALGQNGHDDILIAGTASPVIGPLLANTGALQLAPAKASAIAVTDSATPTIRNLTGLSGMDGDVIRIADAARPVLTNVQINWPSGALTANLATCVNITGTGGGVTMNQVYMHGCGKGGVYLRRAAGGSAIRHALTDVRVNQSGGATASNEGYGLWLDSQSDVSGVEISGGRFTSNRGHGIAVLNSDVIISGATMQDNGNEPSTGQCWGGNGLSIQSGLAVVVVTNSIMSGNKGRTSPPAGSACGTGNGVRISAGRLNLQNSEATNNAFDGLLAESAASEIVVTNNLFSGNAANGIGVNASAPIQLGQCSGFPTSCTAGSNYFHCPRTGGFAGNGRMNLCLVTPVISRTLNAQFNEWEASPPTVVEADYDGNNAHCTGMSSADIGNVNSAFSFIFGPNTINTAPEKAQRTCN